MLEVIFLAVALSMDAFAVSIGLGSGRKTQPFSLALASGFYFGLFQALMPLIGFAGGKGILGWIGPYAPWVAFGLLCLIGGKMILESFTDGVEDAIPVISHKIMLLLAIATSIDAMAAGFSLSLLNVDIAIACLVIGLTTFVFSFLGVCLGSRSGTWLEGRAEFFGGVVLVLIGFRVLLL